MRRSSSWLFMAIFVAAAAGCADKSPAPEKKDAPKAAEAPKAEAPKEAAPAPKEEPAKQAEPVKKEEVKPVETKVEPQPAAQKEAAKAEPAAADWAAKAKEWLDPYQKDFAAAEGASATAYWKAANSGTKEDFDVYAEKDLAFRTLHSDPQRYAALEELLKHPEAYDALTLRSLQVAELFFKGNQLPKELLEKMVTMSAAIEQKFKSFRGTLDGKKYTNNELLEMLGKETDSARRKAIWEALKEVGDQVGADLIALAKVRNEAAKHLGYANFWEMQIRLQEHDPDMLLKLFADLEAATNEPFAKMKATMDAEIAKKLNVKPEEMMPWHYDNPFFQAAPPSEKVNLDMFYSGKTKEEIVQLGVKFYQDLGLPMDDIAAQSDYYEREGKDQHAFCITLDRLNNVRMLLNVTPTEEWMDTMLHESGHAVYYKYINRDLPYNLRESAHIFTTEAVAMLFGALAKNPTWLVTYAGADPAKVQELTPAILEQRQREQLIFARWTMVMLHFEKALYENPDQDLNKLWYDMVERFQMLHRPEGRNLADWASKPHFSMSPVYYHNYMLGELFAAQLRATLKANLKLEGSTATMAYFGKPEVGQFFIEKVFKPGMTTPWPQFVQESTGMPLGIAAYAEEVK